MARAPQEVRWKSRLDLCREKWGELVVDATEVMRRGQILEPLVAELYIRATGNQTVPSAWMASTEHPFMAATPDLGDVTDDCLVHASCRSRRARHGRVNRGARRTLRTFIRSKRQPCLMIIFCSASTRWQ
jgi:hypothetical protein